MFGNGHAVHSPHKLPHHHHGSGSGSGSSIRVSTVMIGLASLLLVTLMGQMYLLSKNHSGPGVGGGKIQKSPLIRSVPTLLPVMGVDDKLDKIDAHQGSHITRVHGTRVAIIVVYVGSSLPAWFDSFAQTAAISDDMFDWFLFVTKVPPRRTPRNLKMIKLTEDELFSHFAN
jgi:hypothetical protein